MRTRAVAVFGRVVCAAAFVVACGGTTPPAASPPSGSPATSDQPSPAASSVLTVTPLTLPAIDDAIPAAMESEVAQVDVLRREAGIAALLGADGEAALAAIGDRQAQHAAADLPALVEALGISGAIRPLAFAGGSPESVPGAFQDWTPTYSGRTAYTASMLTALLAESVSSADSDRARNSLASDETSDRTSGDIREHITVRTTLTLETGGGRISGEVELVTTTQATSVSTGMVIGTLNATAHGQIDVNACPDADGVAEGNIAMSWEETITTASGSSAGGSASFDAPVRMLDGDDAHLIQTELDISFANGAHGPGTPGGSPGAPFDWSFQGAMSVVVPRSGQVSIPAISGESNGASDSQAAGAATYALTQASLIVYQIAEKAERFWRDGKCVEVRTSEETREVDPEEELAINLDAAHKFDGAQVKGKAETTFTGTKEIRPTESIETPGELTFVAGEDPGDEGTLEIKHISKRGIGKKTLNFTVKGGYFIALDGQLGIDAQNHSEITVSAQEMIAQDDGSYVLETDASVSGTHGIPGCTESFTHTLPIRITVRPAGGEPPTANLRVELNGTDGLLAFPLTCDGVMTLSPVPLGLWAYSFNTLTSPGATVTIDEPTTVTGPAGGTSTVVDLTTSD
ncbi:MAG: hypothetical protein ABI797_04285 [Chloroflexota bacterium]